MQHRSIYGFVLVLLACWLIFTHDFFNSKEIHVRAPLDMIAQLAAYKEELSNTKVKSCNYEV